VFYLIKKIEISSSLLETMANVIAMSILRALIMVLKYHFSLKVARLLREMAHSRSGAGNTQVGPGISLSSEIARKLIKTASVMSK